MNAVIVARSVDLAFKCTVSNAYRDVLKLEAAKTRTSRREEPWEVRLEYQQCCRELEKQSVVFGSIVAQTLLPQIVKSDDDLLLLTSGKDVSKWADLDLNITLRQRLRHPIEKPDLRTSYQTLYDIFLAKLRAMESCLKALEIELRCARSFLDSGVDREVSHAEQHRVHGKLLITFIQAQRSRWSNCGGQRKKLLESLERSNTCLQDLLDPMKEALPMLQTLPFQNFQQTEERKNVQPWEIWRHAEDFYSLFSKAWCCNCIAMHHFKLRLQHRSSRDVYFSILLQFDKSQSVLDHPWTYRQMLFKMIEVEYKPTPRQKTRFIEPILRHSPLTEGPNITDFCCALKECRPESRHIGCLQEGAKCYCVYQDLEETESWSNGGAQEEKCLATALGHNIYECPGMVGRWLLALELASTISQLYSTPWLNHEWSKRDIVYYRKGPNSSSFTWQEPYL
jgi:hypothetical protein